MKENVKLSVNGMIGINDLILKGEIVVFGSTYMANFPLYEFINKYHFENAIYNRSIAGLTTSEALEIVQDCIISINPAKIFMGDTGSLLLGALAVSRAFSSESPLSVIPIGVIYVIEGVSVIMQVLFFKLTKRRIFKMAPLHHHLEKSGMSENKICIIAIIITLLSSVLTFLVK